MTSDPSTIETDPVSIAQSLIRCPSVTPEEAGALDYLEALLKAGGFKTRRLPFSDPDSYDVDNLYARYGTGEPHFCYAGHTDVVPVGTLSDWTYGPFDASIDDGVLYGRGACDMKGGIASFVAAALRFTRDNPDFPGSISLLITGDEEADAINGTIKVLEWMMDNGETPDACIVGEPTNPESLGDALKVGRRGSLSGALIVEGVQGHVAYQHQADNPIPRVLPLLSALVGEPFDEGNDHFPPTNLEITSVDVGNEVSNIIPARVSARFNIRFNTTWTADSLKAEIERRLAEAALPDTNYKLTFRTIYSDVFLTASPSLIEPLTEAIRAVTGKDVRQSTSGGTSDARFVKNYCPVVEFGLVSKTLHKVDENTSIADLLALSDIYYAFLERYFEGSRAS